MVECRAKRITMAVMSRPTFRVLHPGHPHFPPISEADEDGLLALGGDLTVEWLRLAYHMGIFPWTDNPITWWAPDPRAVFDIESFEPPKRLAKKVRQNRVTITFDQAFQRVIRNCAKPAPGREQTWIGPGLRKAYTALHKAGHAHSVEAWQGDGLVAGVYGVSFGGFFAGESMFHRVTDTSKIALVHLFNHLRDRGYVLFDTQVLSPLTESLGAIEIPRSDYMKRLRDALALPVTWQE